MMEKFKDSFKDQTVWIIGKGPSLRYLTKEYIESGPVITLNQSIIKVEELDLPNSIFSMQKDGGKRKRYRARYSIPDCDYSPNCGDRCGPMYRPKKGATLLVQKAESLYCFPDYSPRYVFECPKFGLHPNQISLIVAVKIGVLFGCAKFHFVSCDRHAIDCGGQYIPNVGVVRPGRGYGSQVKRIKPYLVRLDHKWITPIKK